MAEPSRRGLGRGLDALLPPAGTRVVQVPVARIRPNRRQPRLEAEPLQLRQLADSVAIHGVIQPVVVTEEFSEHGTWYELVAGERRWRAAQIAGLETIPAVVRTADERARLQLALVENLQREDLNPLDRARAYAALAKEFGLTQEEIARNVGKSRSAVANTLRLLALPETARNALAEGRITEGHARAILAVRDDTGKDELLLRILREGLSVRRAERLPVSRRPGARVVDPGTEALQEQFQEALGTKVELQRSGESGKLVIYFYSQEELEALHGLIVGGQEVSRETADAQGLAPARGPT